jgi:RNA polymerase sigma factor (sigma-70 family)
MRAGDAGAWDLLDRRYRGALERFARRMLHDVAPDQVEDVVQEALWRAHRALQRDTRVLELRPWLYRLTRNCCLDERARVRTDAVELERAAEIADRADGPAAILERRGALRTLLDDVARLPDLQRHALLRRELDGLSHDEVAAELGLTVVATRSLVHRARGALTRAAEGRALGCGDVRSDILEAHDRRRRPTARTLRHLATCSTCRALQSALRSQRRSLAALAPPVGLLAALGGIGFAGWHAKATAIGTSAVVAAGVSVELFQAGDPAPLALRSIALPGKQVAAGAPIPSGVAVVRGAVRYPEVRTVTLACPPGLRLADLLPPEGGRVSAHYGEGTTIGAARTGEIVLTGPGRDAKVTVSVLCRPSSAITGASQQTRRQMTP